MSDKNKTQTTQPSGLSFTKENFRWMIIGVIVIALGMILLSGGENKDPNVFNTNLVYSFRRITLAPIVILIGFGIEIFAILKKSKKEEA
ncbi:hypothetical protein A9P82_03045 [Arachidicoccus ginsenosidimutans]|uniref:DUF3098 domain-containing protein n=1 Tax=Arachidicoccus sp. BS20 TaxID=1850526 RepID=UPI0007F0BF13|nr:DUF3098 domain-containing protein [Arachidicoccus sp. BS20]ANI88365.1 hypothetical protein A9P82_03045 [Arachidicoccus sp. BS20]